MPSFPGWPAADGPRILTLAGNDLTIDVRARKTASSLSRVGFSVIAIGVDNSGKTPTVEMSDGALLYRVVPMTDPRISPRILRFSRPEIRDSLRYRVEVQRQRLQMARRNLTAWRRWALRDLNSRAERREEPPPLPTIAKRMSELRRKVRNHSMRLRFEFRLRAKRARVITTQLRFKSLNNLYKAVARPPKRALRRGSWRRDLPELHRYEASLGSIVDHLDPDLIHVHDIFHLGLAARAAARASQREMRIPVVYDAHEYIAGLPGDPRRRKAYTDLEDEYISRADAVVTVSDAMADAIRARYGVHPVVVMNTPDLDTAITSEPVRSVIGVPEESKLVIYVGGVAPSRGAEDLLHAMTHLPLNAHLAFITGPITGYVSSLIDIAKDLGLGGRVHFAPFVAPEAVVSHIGSADVSVIPLSRDVPNYEVTLPNKLFQSIHAGLPVVVSDNPAMAEFVSKHNLGEVFEGGRPAEMAKAIQKVLDHPELYRAGLENRELLESATWRAQFRNLLDVYGSVGVRSR